MSDKILSTDTVKTCTAKEKDFRVLYSMKFAERSQEQETEVTEDGERVYKDTVVRKKQKKDHVILDVGDLVPEGSIQTSNIQFVVKGEAQVELRLRYSPNDEEEQ